MASMNLHEFNYHIRQERAELVWEYGRFLCIRYKGGCSIVLYHMGESLCRGVVLAHAKPHQARARVQQPGRPGALPEDDRFKDIDGVGIVKPPALQRGGFTAN